MKEEAVHNVPLGVISAIRNETARDPGNNLYSYVHQGKEIGGVAMRTPPYPGLISRVEDARASKQLTDVLLDTYPALEAINVLVEDPSPVGNRLDKHGIEWTLKKDQRIYRTSEVDVPTNVEGSWRQVEENDHERIVEWLKGFSRDVDGELNVSPDQSAETLVVDRDGYFWCVNGTPVSMAGYSGRTPNGVRISYVYTRPEYRGNGYGSAITAIATREALAAGCDYGFLYTELSNDITNYIYPAIGYEPVADQYKYQLHNRSSSSP